MSGLTQHLGRGLLVAGLVVAAPGAQAGRWGDPPESLSFPAMGFGGGVSKTQDAWVADLRLADTTLCFGIIVCAQATAVRWRPGAGDEDDNDAEYRQYRQHRYYR